MSHSRLSALTMIVALLASCSKPPKEPPRAESEASASARIRAIPPADPKYVNMRDLSNWRNPYLIIGEDGVGLLLSSISNQQRLLKPEELAHVLAQLPASAWPYGRVVAVAENGVSGSEDHKVRMRKNRALVAGTLEILQVAINWVPST